jgi:uncharacterized phage protein (TIGR02218 family)
LKDLPLTATDIVQTPVRLVTITRLDEVEILITEAEEDVTVGSDTFLSLVGCEISAVEHTLGGSVPSMQISFAHSDGGTFDSREIHEGVFDGAAVRLYIADRDNLAAGKGLLFSGEIQPIEYDPVSGSGAFTIKGPANQAESIIQTYGPMCRTDLFSSLCTLNPATYAQTGTIGSITNKFECVIAGLASPPADGWFNLGVGVTDSGVSFEIAEWTQSTLTLKTFLPRCALFTVADGVTLYPGCDKTIATCKNKYSNNLNFQAEPHWTGLAVTSATGP